MIRTLITLFRLKLSLLNGIAAVAGCLLFPAASRALPAFTAITAFTGVFLLAAGSSAFNQVIERNLDSRMMRTRLRPLPTGAMSITAALFLAGSAVVSGLLVLVSAGDGKPGICGAIAVVWYLGVYTPLKRYSSLTLLIGGLCGAFPPLIGWSLAGGHPGDFRIVILAGLLFLWQVPHFWLFQRRHAEDYRRVGIPLFCVGGKLYGYNLFFWLWLGALSVGALLLPLFGLIGRPGAFWYMLFPVPLVFLSAFRSGRHLFSYINCFPLLVTLLLMIQKRC
ncbi:MAG: protoheme IX farnesyltransferase [Desulfuromonadaceae bacterium]|nr:protoheme IX farnesyltransferase [Desulfuromonadaceae bacterium]